MNDTPASHPNAGDEHRAPPPLAESDLLITRIIDGEDLPTDRARFEALADLDPVLWRRLALRQQDMALLSARVQEELISATGQELPVANLNDQTVVAGRIAPMRSWFLALSGWAALIVVAATWSITVAHRGSDRDNNPAFHQATNSNAAPDMSPDEHFREYRKAPFVVNELPPTLLQVETLPDGRQAMRVLRRIEEVVFISPNAKLPVDSDSSLTKPPADLRQNAIESPQPN